LAIPSTTVFVCKSRKNPPPEICVFWDTFPHYQGGNQFIGIAKLAMAGKHNQFMGVNINEQTLSLEHHSVSPYKPISSKSYIPVISSHV
jgi:hypothetical protein